jgi:hypothetical protein
MSGAFAELALRLIAALVGALVVGPAGLGVVQAHDQIDLLAQIAMTPIQNLLAATDFSDLSRLAADRAARLASAAGGACSWFTRSAAVRWPSWSNCWGWRARYQRS